MYHNYEKLEDITKNISDELDYQAKLLDDMEKDVEKYNAQLGKINMYMDKALSQVGGATKMTMYLIL